MKKQVFLFELDSVRKTDDEIIVGQKTLYDEIVRNGNIVVLTYNQLIDSRAFFSLLNNKNYEIAQLAEEISNIHLSNSDETMRKIICTKIFRSMN